MFIFFSFEIRICPAPGPLEKTVLRNHYFLIPAFLKGEFCVAFGSLAKTLKRPSVKVAAYPPKGQQESHWCLFFKALSKPINGSPFPF
jgi:hypothetical protein